MTRIASSPLTLAAISTREGRQNLWFSLFYFRADEDRIVPCSGTNDTGLGGHPGAMRHRLHTGRAIAAGDVPTPRRFVNNLACFTIGADPWAAPAAPLSGYFHLSHAMAIFISVMLLHGTSHSIDSPGAAGIFALLSF
jgi:hypothetical protein